VVSSMRSGKITRKGSAMGLMLRGFNRVAERSCYVTDLVFLASRERPVAL